MNTCERETVIRDKRGNSNRSGDDNDKRENEERMISGEATPPLTPTHSLILSQITTPNTSFAFLINPTIGHLRDYISDYATCVSVDIPSLAIS